MYIGLYFGSFNPVHQGHIAIAEYMYRQFCFDEIWFIVSPSNPLKEKIDLLDEHKRLKLVQTAIQNKPYFRASDIEFQMEKPSYTYLTLRKIHAENPQHRFSLLLGGDSIEDIKLWKNYEEILQNYTIHVYPRSGKTGNIAGKNIIFAHPPLLDISSTLIRERIKRGEDVSGLIPLNVFQIIKKEKFYL